MRRNDYFVVQFGMADCRSSFVRFVRALFRSGFVSEQRRFVRQPNKCFVFLSVFFRVLVLCLFHRRALHWRSVDAQKIYYFNSMSLRHLLEHFSLQSFQMVQFSFRRLRRRLRIIYFILFVCVRMSSLFAFRCGAMGNGTRWFSVNGRWSMAARTTNVNLWSEKGEMEKLVNHH